jgi:ABC-type bacteriocin/lantibiotic exporter with double-glycine peptidase domain
LLPALRIVAQGVTVLCLIAVMVWVQPLVAAVAVAALGLAYSGVYLLLRRFLARSGADRVQANQERFKIVHEAFGGIKELKVAGSERAYLRAFRNPALRFSRHQANNQIVAQLPRFAIEGLGLGAALAAVLALLAWTRGDLSTYVPVLGVYAFAGRRLVPAFQEIYRSAATLRFGRPALDALYDDFFQYQTDAAANGSASTQSNTPALVLRERLEFRNVCFAFTGSSHTVPALRGIDLEIQAGQVTGIVGATGAGKSTLVDLMLGLLRPTYGEIKIDGQVLTNDLIPDWQRSIGYVPQHIFLADESVAANIAFGVTPQKIDRDAVECAARQAQIHDFIVSELPEGYETKVGERGIRLSGGQKQRIGLARALYRDPSTLILDEATSALDNQTEHAVMHAIYQFGQSKTIVLIAHRLATVQKCDTIIVLDHGTIRDTGTYRDLSQRDPLFPQIASATIKNE